MTDAAHHPRREDGRLGAALAMLRRLEWVPGWHTDWLRCWVCHAPRHLGHAKGCELSALLREPEGAAGAGGEG